MDLFSYEIGRLAIIPVLKKANYDANGHMFKPDILEKKLFDEYLERQMADNTAGMTPQDRKTVKLLGQINKAVADLSDRAKVPLKTIDQVAFKLRKLKLMMDNDYRKTLTLKQRLLLDQMHQSILTHGLVEYLKSTGVEVIPYWDWSGVFRSMGTIWRQIISRWAFVELLIFPKFRGTNISYGKAMYLAWVGFDRDPEIVRSEDYKNAIYNKATTYWHRVYVAGIISILAFFSYDQYDQTQQAKAIQVAANAAAAEEVAQIPERQKENWIHRKHNSIIAGYTKKYGPPSDDVRAEMRIAAQMLYDQEMKKIEEMSVPND